ncbi:MAG TPA: MarR family transcriptional regulator [Gemmatimonadaceae bacterium]|nr:MarR family transcriptional regulator [Gemmatimonadaceae bacterium]
MSAILDPAQERFVEHIGLLWEGQGLSRVAGRIVGFLTLQDAPRSLDEIATALNVSKGSVSTDARLLQARGLLERTPAPAGDRRDYYVVAPDLPVAVLEERRRELHGLASALEAAVALPDTPKAVSSRLKRFCDIYRAVARQLEQLIAAPAKAGGTRTTTPRTP